MRRQVAARIRPATLALALTTSCRTTQAVRVPLSDATRRDCAAACVGAPDPYACLSACPGADEVLGTCPTPAAPAALACAQKESTTGAAIAVGALLIFVVVVGVGFMTMDNT